MTEIDKAELVRRAAAGDALAWRQLIDDYGPVLRRVAGSYRLGEAQTADVVATAWMRLVEHITLLRDGRRVGGWLVTTVRRESLARLRQGRRELLVDHFSAKHEPSYDIRPEGRLTAEDRRRVVARAMAQLPDRKRRLAIMLFADPAPSYQEISEQLSIPVGSIGPTRIRLLRNLRDIMAADETELLAAG